jgi:branched-chain amino acid transport system ATP-binding protein
LSVVEPVLRLDGLSKSFGSLLVTDNVSLDVMPGELHALIGPNGAGKTSLINQISGFLSPDKGRIFFGGEDITALPPHARARRGLARSFQITSILPGFTVLENVALAVQAHEGSSFRFTGRASAEPELNRPAMAALEETGLAASSAKRAGELSHGERRALEIAIALAMKPKLFLLDEPLAGVGREETIAQMNLLRTLKGSISIILVEHDIPAVFALADRISVLIYGRIAACGAPAEVRANAEVAAAYLGT